MQPGPRPESQAGGEAATGTIRSPNFVVTGDLIEFLANGWDGHAGHRGFNAYFLKRASDGKILRRAVPPQQDGFVPVYWLVFDLKGQSVYFEAVDHDNNHNGTGPGFSWLGFAGLQMVTLDVPAGKSRLYAVPLAPAKKFQLGSQTDTFGQAAGIPFLLSQPVPLKSGGTWTIPLQQRVQRLCLAGFTISGYSQDQFIGQRRGTLVLDYADGKSVRYPLIYGYNLWCRPSLMQEYPQPFASNAAARGVLDRTLALKPVHLQRGRVATEYMATIAPRPVKIKDIRLVANPKYERVPDIVGLTVLRLQPPVRVGGAAAWLGYGPGEAMACPARPAAEGATRAKSSGCVSLFVWNPLYESE